jgi:hypothetical protein
MMLQLEVYGIWADQAEALDPEQWVTVVLVNHLVPSELRGVCRVKEVDRLVNSEEAPVDEFLLIPCQSS